MKLVISSIFIAEKSPRSTEFLLTNRRLSIPDVHSNYPQWLICQIPRQRKTEVFKSQVTIIYFANNQGSEKYIFWQECCNLEPMHSTYREWRERIPTVHLSWVNWYQIQEINWHAWWQKEWKIVPFARFIYQKIYLDLFLLLMD